MSSYVSVSFEDPSFDDKNSDYAEIGSEETSSGCELERNRVELGDILGAGQFGDVFRGTLRFDDQLMPVAVKTCKLEREDEMAEKLLQEANIMERFDHRHIIRFYGVCSSPPVWIIMELAELGEIKKFLKENRDRLSIDQLILYCHQLSTAMLYLENRHIVHRDIAARNVLISSWNCVKLADFGLSRWLTEYKDYYKASKSMKLPIKWMAPESINYRRFTTASDVWMFGVCMWEIVMLGEKPFTDVKNNEVIEMLESGVRLPLPSTPGCPPSIYLVMCQCWQLEPENRPRFAEIERRIYEILLDEKNMKEVELSKNRLTKTRTLGSSMDGENPPEKPSRSLSRRHSGFVGRSTPELDTVNRYQHPDADRLGLHFPPPPAWKSVNALHDKTDSGNRTNAADLYQRSLMNATCNIMSPPTLEDTLRRQEMQSHMDSSWLKVMVDNKAKSQTHAYETGFLVRYPAEETESKRADDKEWKELLSEIELDRNADNVYSATVDVVKAVAAMSRNEDDSRNNAMSGQHLTQQHYVSMIMNIGVKLKVLMTNVDNAIVSLPIESKAQIIMATNVLNSDMATMIHKMKLAQQYSNTAVLDMDYKKSMFQAGHALAVDSRNLLEAVDIARKKQIYLQRQRQQQQQQQRPNMITDY